MMFKRLKRLKSKKGFTLAELIVTIAVSTLIVAAAVGLFSPAMGLINSIKSNTNLDVMCDTANEYIRSCLQSAGNVSICSFNLTDLDSVEDKIDGIVVHDGYKVHALGYMGNKLYDFGEVTSSADIASKIANYDEHRVFNNAFYGITNYKLSFSSGGNGDERWITLMGQCFEESGSVANQGRSMSFKVLDARAAVTSDIDATHSNFIIIYTVYDPTT